MPNSKAVYHWDFTVFAERFQHFRESGFWSSKYYPFTYPASSGLAFAFFYKLPHPVWAYLSFLALLIVGGAWLWAAQLKERGVSGYAAAVFVIVFILSYPFRFEVQRANIEGIVVLFTAGSILAFLRRRYWITGALIGIAGAMKLFPLILLGLLFSARKYREMVWGLGVAIAANCFSLWVLGPNMTVANRQIERGLRAFQRTYLLNDFRGLLYYDHSLFTLIKLPVIKLGGANPAHLLQVGSTIYLASMALLGLLLFFGVIQKLPLLNQILILTLCAVSLPPISFDYTLLHLAVPFALLSLYAVDTWNAGETNAKGLNTAMCLFGLIFADLNFFGVHGQFMGPARAIVIAALMITLMRYPLRWTPCADLTDEGAIPVRPH